MNNAIDKEVRDIMKPLILHSDWKGHTLLEDIMKELSALIQKEREEATEGHKHTCGRCGDEFWTAQFLDTYSTLCDICFKGLTNCKSFEEREEYLSQTKGEE